MTPAQESRRKAELCRRMANHPTQGGRLVDRILIALAERLEREADTSQNKEDREASPR
jgi:hypothetical protein